MTLFDPSRDVLTGPAAVFSFDTALANEIGGGVALKVKTINRCSCRSRVST